MSRVFVKHFCVYCEFEHDLLLIDFKEDGGYQVVVLQCPADNFEFELNINTRRHKKFIPPKEFFEQ